jgi:hypothetical protein
MSRTDLPAALRQTLECAETSGVISPPAWQQGGTAARMPLSASAPKPGACHGGGVEGCPPH